jgi:predicted nucleic acid-binding protein
MIVLDASVVVELLINGPLAEAIRHELIQDNDAMIVPYLIDIEVVSALRHLAAAQRVDQHRWEHALADLAALPAERCSHLPLIPRIWELRHNFTAYDAAYIALAEATNSVLYTSDLNLRKGHRAGVVVFSS